jgi:hypothetical protein
MKAERKAVKGRIEADRQKDREYLKRMMVEMNAKMDSNQAEMRSTVCAIGSVEGDQRTRDKSRNTTNTVRVG